MDCPYVIEDPDGTAYCGLAEATVRQLRERIADLEAELTRVLAKRHSDEPGR